MPPLTLDRLTEINAAVSEFRAARGEVTAADALVPITDTQTVYVGEKSGGQVYRKSIDVPRSIINTLIRDRRTVAAARLAAAERKLHQLNVQVPA